MSEPVPFTGVTVKVSPLQIEAVLAVITGLGFTVTVKVNVAPVQFKLVFGVTV